MRPRPLLGLAAGVAGLLLLVGCGGTEQPEAAGGGPDLSGELSVLAAASLTEPFTELADRFESGHPDAEVRLAFDSSATLAEQVVQGAPADVLATADEPTMAVAVDAGATDGDPEVFATNRLVLVAPADNPAGIESLADLDGDVDYVVCVASAPCGALARDLLADAAVTASPASEEVDVKAVLSKVQLDEADAGLVYASDAVAAGASVSQVEPPADGTAATSYPIARVAEASEPDLAAAWVDLVTSPAGQDALAAAGFGPPVP
jgi:molybdate transport system substrate-binding protein